MYKLKNEIGSGSRMKIYRFHIPICLIYPKMTAITFSLYKMVEDQFFASFLQIWSHKKIGHHPQVRRLF